MKGTKNSEGMDFSKFQIKPIYAHQVSKMKFEFEKIKTPTPNNFRKLPLEYLPLESKDISSKIKIEDINIKEKKESFNFDNYRVKVSDLSQKEVSNLQKRPNSESVLRGGEFGKQALQKRKDNCSPQRILVGDEGMKKKLNELKQEWQNNTNNNLSNQGWSRKASLCFNILTSLVKSEGGFIPQCVEALTDENDVWRIFFSTVYHLLFCYDQDVRSFISSMNPNSNSNQVLQKLDSLAWCETGTTQFDQSNNFKRKKQKIKALQYSLCIDSQQQSQACESRLSNLVVDAQNSTIRRYSSGLSESCFALESNTSKNNDQNCLLEALENQDHLNFIQSQQIEPNTFNKQIQTHKEIVFSLINLLKQQKNSQIEHQGILMKKDEKIKDLQNQLNELTVKLNLEYVHTKQLSKQLEQRQQEQKEQKEEITQMQKEKVDLRKQIHLLKIQLIEVLETKYTKDQVLSPFMQSICQTPERGQQNRVQSCKNDSNQRVFNKDLKIQPEVIKNDQNTSKIRKNSISLNVSTLKNKEDTKLNQSCNEIESHTILIKKEEILLSPKKMCQTVNINDLVNNKTQEDQSKLTNGEWFQKHLPPGNDILPRRDPQLKNKKEPTSQQFPNIENHTTRNSNQFNKKTKGIFIYEYNSPKTTLEQRRQSNSLTSRNAPSEQKRNIEEALRFSSIEDNLLLESEIQMKVEHQQAGHKLQLDQICNVKSKNAWKQQQQDPLQLHQQQQQQGDSMFQDEQIWSNNKNYKFQIPFIKKEESSKSHSLDAKKARDKFLQFIRIAAKQS